MGGLCGSRVVVRQGEAMFMTSSAVGTRKAVIRWFGRSADVGAVLLQQHVG